MNAIGLSLILKMGCLCSKKTLTVNDRRFVIRGHLGDGGFSTVHLVEDMRTHKQYAVKRMTCHSPDDQKKAMAEVEFHKVLQHPNIIECIDSSLIGKPDMLQNSTSEVLLLLPYHQRGTLAADLERRSKTNDHMPEERVLNMFRQICEGVKAMHECKPHGLAHRDLKTANILISNDYTPIIMDLGSMARARVEIANNNEARKLQDQAAERSSMPYRAPELFHVESLDSIDERTDIWSLGCILYAMCFFKSPFDIVYERGDSVALAVFSANITIPENSPYSEGLHNLIHFMMRVDHHERPFIQNVIEKTVDLIVKAEGKL